MTSVNEVDDRGCWVPGTCVTLPSATKSGFVCGRGTLGCTEAHGPTTYLSTVKVKPLIRLRWRTRLRIWWFNRRLSPEIRELLRQVAETHEYQVINGSPCTCYFTPAGPVACSFCLDEARE